MYKILIVEDELISAEYLKNILEHRGWRVVDVVDNGLDAIRCVKKHNPNLVLMDIMIHGAKSGCEVAMDIRKINDCFIVFITAYADEEMINYAMEVEANGYLLKPYNEKEIIATISLLSIKQNCNTKQYKISTLMGGFCFNHDTNLLYKENEIVKLGPKALKVIQILCQNRESIVSYEELYNSIWNDDVNLKKLQMVVFRIREICATDILENINGVGYKIKIDPFFVTPR